MNLKRYYGQTVSITSINNQLFVGIVSDYFYPEDNESNVESIVVDTPKNGIVEFCEKDIKKITII